MLDRTEPDEQSEEAEITLIEDRKGPCQVDQPLLLFVWKTYQKVKRSPTAHGFVNSAASSLRWTQRRDDEQELRELLHSAGLDLNSSF